MGIKTRTGSWRTCRTMERTGRPGARGPQLGLRLIKRLVMKRACVIKFLFQFSFLFISLSTYSLRRCTFFRSNQEPKPYKECDFLGVSLSEDSSHGFPSPEQRQKSHCAHADQHLQHDKVVKRLLKWVKSHPEALDEPTTEPREPQMSSVEPRVESSGCVPWKKLFRPRRRKGRADKRPAAAEKTGASLILPPGDPWQRWQRWQRWLWAWQCSMRESYHITHD